MVVGSKNKGGIFKMSREELQQYNREYYYRNKKLLSDKRKKKYKDSAEYRETIRKARVKFYSKKQQELGGYVVREYNGKVIKVLKIGKVLAKLGISRKLIIRWEEAGLLPHTLHDFGTSRCYTDHQVFLMGKVVEAHKFERTVAELKKKFKTMLSKGWLRGL